MVSAAQQLLQKVTHYLELRIELAVTEIRMQLVEAVALAVVGLVWIWLGSLALVFAGLSIGFATGASRQYAYGFGIVAGVLGFLLLTTALFHRRVRVWIVAILQRRSDALVLHSKSAETATVLHENSSPPVAES